jgi:hypothetical protein
MVDYFNFEYLDLRILFKGWETNTLTSKHVDNLFLEENCYIQFPVVYVLTCVGVFAIAMVYECILFIQNYIDLNYRWPPSCSTK